MSSITTALRQKIEFQDLPERSAPVSSETMSMIHGGGRCFDIICPPGKRCQSVFDPRTGRLISRKCV